MRAREEGARERSARDGAGDGKREHRDGGGGEMDFLFWGINVAI